MSITTSSAPCALRGPDGLAIIGPSRFQLRGIRLEEGEDGAGGEQQPKGGDAPWTKDNFDPERAWQLVQNLRADNKTMKDGQAAAIQSAVDAATADFTKNLAKALGGGDEPESDPVKLNATIQQFTTDLADAKTELTAAQAQLKAAQVASQVAILAGPLGGNITALLANEKFKTSIGTVEPTDEAAITAAITQALQDNAALKQPPARSGAGEHTGATITSLESQLKAAQEAKNVSETIRLKRAIVAAQAQAK